MTVDIAVWPPWCGSEYGLEYDAEGEPVPNRFVAGAPVICTKPVHDDTEKHFNGELGFAWS